MELNLTTFILEIVNFLVLVWILKRLFFVPVKRTIEARKASIAKTLSDAQTLKSEANKLLAQYEDRINAWENEKSKARIALEEAMNEEKAKRLQQIEATIEAERQKMRAQDERKRMEERERIERETIRQSATFVSRMFASIASPDMETKLIKMALGRLPEIKLNTTEHSGKWEVRTAYELGQDQKGFICEVIKNAFGPKITVGFSVDGSLLAGTEILLGSTVVRANLRDELAFFVESGSA